MVDAQSLKRGFEQRAPLLMELARTLDSKAREALEDVPHIDRVAFRVKDAGSFATKASKPQYSHPFIELEDQVAGRVITFFRDDIEVVRGRLTNYFGTVEHQAKTPSGPLEFGYESDHFIFTIAQHMKPVGWSDFTDMPRTFELQIRTLFMHAWAEPQHDLGYKGDIDDETKRELAWIAASAWGADRMLNDIAKRTS